MTAFEKITAQQGEEGTPVWMVGEQLKVKTKKRICGWVFGLCFLSAYGVCGSLECQTIGNLCGDILLLTLLVVGTLAGYKGGYIWF